ncbi:ABC transporter related [Methanococcus vannielii SB]|uniref:Molybdate/tungstate import ATP-binding protein WtpC n=1 Tax=Methanococcus vannielii (strain ATCC 35089 / DSM 1224 / JCM 13029 / OCM 148 / SB) TaxID=406327 RepID=A6USN6_METVS|nr:ATP-binding cassette domain-containing protein [Methanococcus vannielii]ABR55508.1 ABC transporter related [Methanococcus vannielii SB]
MLSIRNLKKKLSNFEINLENLDIKDNDYFVILGLSGSGKTTILEMIAGYKKPDSGKILLDGEDITNKPLHERKIVLCNGKYLFPHLSVRKNIEYGIKNLKKSERDVKVNKISNLLNISHLLDKNPKKISSGEQQRVALGMALIMEPKIILLDEPLSSLDRLIHEKLLYDLKEIHTSSSVTFIHVTHDFLEAVVLSKNMAIVKNGIIEQSGTLKNIIKNPKNIFVAQFLGVKNILPIGKLKENNTSNTLKTIKNEIENLSENSLIGIFSKDVKILPKNVLVPFNTHNGKIKNIFEEPFNSKITIEFNGVDIISEVSNTKIIKNPFKKGDSINFYIESYSIIGGNF